MWSKIGVREPNPSEVGWVDHPAEHGHELVDLHHRTGIDQEWFGPIQHERVDRNDPEAGNREAGGEDVEAGCGGVGRDHGLSSPSMSVVVLCLWLSSVPRISSPWA